MHKIRFNFSEALDYRTVKGFPASIILAAQSKPAYNLLFSLSLALVRCSGTRHAVPWGDDPRAQQVVCSGLKIKGRRGSQTKVIKDTMHCYR